MNTTIFLFTNSARRLFRLGIALSATMLTTSASALDEPKLTVTYSLETLDGGAYLQKISDTPLGIGDVDYVLDVVDSGDPNVVVLVDNPLFVTMEFTADAPGGNIVDGPVELTNTHFDREFNIDSGGLTLVNTVITTNLFQIGTGTLSGSTITWDNVVAPYQESAVGEATCTGFGCSFATDPFPRDLDQIVDVSLPNFTVFTNVIFGDSFASDNGTPGDPADDIDRPDADASVKDTWVPEPSREVLLLAGALGLVALLRLHGRAGDFDRIATPR